MSVKDREQNDKLADRIYVDECRWNIELPRRTAGLFTVEQAVPGGPIHQAGNEHMLPYHILQLSRQQKVISCQKTIILMHIAWVTEIVIVASLENKI